MHHKFIRPIGAPIRIGRPTRRSQATAFLFCAALVAGLVTLAFMQGTR